MVESDTGQTLLIIGSIGEVVSLVSLTVFYPFTTGFGVSIESVVHLGQLAAFCAGSLFDI